MTLEQFAHRCEPAAVDLDDRLCRYISSPQEHDLMEPTTFPFLLLLLSCWVPRVPAPQEPAP